LDSHHPHGWQIADVGTPDDGDHVMFAMRYKLIAQQDDLVSGGARNQMPGILARRVVHRTFSSGTEPCSAPFL
jgi:hypothetical protein